MAVSPLTSLAFTMQSARGGYALLLGSGTSRSAGIQTGWEITLDLIRKVARVQGNPEFANDEELISWYKSTFGGEPDYSRLLEEIADTKEQRQLLLSGYFEPTPEERDEKKKIPQAAHKAIAKLVSLGFIRVIVTTNFDRLIENAIRDEGVEPVVISSSDSISGMQPLVHQKCVVLKVHGDYLDARIRNTSAELAEYSTETSSLLDRIFDEFGLIVAGWSGEWDPALRAAIERSPNRRYGFYWVAHGEPRGAANGLISKRGGAVIKANGADGFFVELLDKVTAIDDMRQEDPRTSDLMVAALKRYVINSGVRIKHDDLYRTEVSRVKAKIDEYLDAEVKKPRKELINADEIFWNLTITLCRMGALSAFYGDARTCDFLKSIYATLTLNPMYVRQGPGFKDEIAIFAGLPFACSIGFGFVLADRFDECLDFVLGASTELQQGKKTFLDAYRDANCDSGALLRISSDEYKKLLTPFSDFICGKARESLVDFALNPFQLEQVTEHFELLCALATTRLDRSGEQTEKKYYYAPGQWVYKIGERVRSNLFPSIPYGDKPDKIERLKHHALMQAIVKRAPFNSDWDKLESAWRYLFSFGFSYRHRRF